MLTWLGLVAGLVAGLGMAEHGQQLTFLPTLGQLGAMKSTLRVLHLWKRGWEGAAEYSCAGVAETMVTADGWAFQQGYCKAKPPAP